ncbi:MAG: pilus assembly protein [Polyangiales bacterium]
MLIAAWCIAVAVWGLGAGLAQAQSAPDIRNIRPIVMLLVDTSGSMERLPNCVCQTPMCRECLPSCSADNPQRNRWAMISEALSGSWSSFACTEQDRQQSTFFGKYDYKYFVPHFALPTDRAQNNDGLLDVYRDRVKFGLMTFDGVDTLVRTDELVESTVFQRSDFLAKSITEPGMYSYGEPKELFFPGCRVPYMLDNGTRNIDAPEGGLISVGTDDADHRIANAKIQEALLGVRPFGKTPVAGMLEDLRYYFANEADVKSVLTEGADGDPYYSCRSRYAVLITDGYPNADYRGAPFYCDAVAPDGAQPYTCPYATPEESAAALCQSSSQSGQCGGVLDGLFVVGFDINDPSAVARLNDIASTGGTESAVFAHDRASLLAKLGAVLDRTAPGTTTRTVPAFGRSVSAGAQARLEFSTGFVVGDSDSDPWSGVLERRRTVCEGLQPTAKAVDSGDKFHEVLNRRIAARRLLTVLPTRAAVVTQTLVGTESGVLPQSLQVRGLAPVDAGVRALPLVPLDAGIDPTYLGLSAGEDARRDRIINWVHAGPDSGRENKRLGDIYHSSPKVVPPPTTDIADESFNLFRAQSLVADRPHVVYVGTNDGILHAFAAEDFRGPSDASSPYAGLSFSAGEELWGFVPPVLLPKLEEAMSGHQWMVDGTPILKDVFYARLPGASPSADSYRTVLLMGLRGGGRAFFALDVTNPVEPKFLWQFTDSDMGESYGEPALAQVLVELGGTLHERAIALLPGGTGSLQSSDSCAVSGDALPPTPTGADAPRRTRRCWRNQGRHFYFVDIASGALLQEIDHTAFKAPLSGGVAVFTGEVGTVSSHGFVSDADGVLWRLDFSAVDPSEWGAQAFYDMFWGAEYDDGQPAYPPPVLSVDSKGQAVLLQATGDIDRLDDIAARNRVASLTEVLTFDDAGRVTDLTVKLNWELKLDAGEQVTGPLTLFGGKTYFGTFTPSSNTVSACDVGQSRLWGVEYIEAQTGTSPPYPAPGFKSDPSLDEADRHTFGPYDNQIVMGTAITQQPKCVSLEDSTVPFVRKRIAASGDAGHQLVAQISGAPGRPNDGGAVNQISIDLETQPAFTQINAWAGYVD